MDKRYQVFVSSTFVDLQEERREVMQALLELGCIPAGMELFPAANEDQWTLIQSVIDDCDYYLVIIGGRYGLLSPNGLSYTELEYQYALDQGKPIIAFLHRAPGTIAANKTEPTPDGRERLDQFRALAQQKMVKFWATPEELGSAVSRSLILLMRTHPGVGWVKADQVLSADASAEILRLRKRIEELETTLISVRTEAPRGTEDFSQGNDQLSIGYSFVSFEYYSVASLEHHADLTTTWNEVFSVMAPHMINDASEEVLKSALNQWVEDTQTSTLYEQDADLTRTERLGNFRVSDADFQTVKVQLRALGLIQQSPRSRSLKDTATYWTLTQYGDGAMTKLRALRRNADASSD